MTALAAVSEFKLLMAAHSDDGGLDVLLDWLEEEDPELRESLCELIDDLGPQVIRACAYLCSDTSEMVGRLEGGSYLGEWESLEHWAEDYLDSAGLLEGLPEYWKIYFDYVKWGRDAERSGDITEVSLEGKSHVFSNHW